jgi:hypothetical protein
MAEAGKGGRNFGWYPRLEENTEAVNEWCYRLNSNPDGVWIRMQECNSLTAGKFRYTAEFYGDFDRLQLHRKKEVYLYKNNSVWSVPATVQYLTFCFPSGTQKVKN